MKTSKKECWQGYVSKLGSSSKPKVLREMIRKIAGKYQTTPIKHLSINNFTITDQNNMADLLVDTFSQNSSSQNGKPKIIDQIKRGKVHVKLSIKNLENYNCLFSLRELKDAIKESHNTAVGLDEAHYEFLRQLPKESLKLLLKIYEKLSKEGKFPDIWFLKQLLKFRIRTCKLK